MHYTFIAKRNPNNNSSDCRMRFCMWLQLACCCYFIILVIACHRSAFTNLYSCLSCKSNKVKEIVFLDEAMSHKWGLNKDQTFVFRGYTLKQQSYCAIKICKFVLICLFLSSFISMSVTALLCIYTSALCGNNNSILILCIMRWQCQAWVYCSYHPKQIILKYIWRTTVNLVTCKTSSPC